MINKRFLALSIPNILSNLVVPLASLVDITVLGQSSDTNPVVAIALGSLIFDYLFVGLNFFRMGTTSLTVKEFGADNSKGVVEVLRQAITMSMVIGVAILLAAPVFHFISLKLLNASSEVAPLISEYFYFRILGAPAILGLMSFNGWYLAQQRAKVCLVLTGIHNVLNIVLTLYFVMSLGMGVKGAAIATAASAWFTFIIFLLKGKKWLIIFRLKSFKESLSKSKMKEFINLNGNLFIRTICLVSVFSIFANLSALLGATLLVVNTLLLRLLSIYSYFIDGFAFSLEAMGGEFYHRNNKQDLKNVVKQAFKVSLITFLIFSLVISLGWDSLISFLNKSELVLAESRSYKMSLILTMFLAIGAYLMDGLFVAFGDSRNLRNNILAAFFGACLVFIIFYYWKLNSILWPALWVFMLIRSVYLAIVFKREYL
jgi:multidrug resistance protein, MATE family